MTGYIEQIIARVPHMKPAELRILRENALNALRRDADNTDARCLLTEVEKRLALPAAGARLIKKKTVIVEWEPHDTYNPHGYRGFVNGSQVARITKQDTHTATRKDVYLVEVMGMELPQLFHHIHDAREAGEVAFQKASSKQ